MKKRMVGCIVAVVVIVAGVALGVFLKTGDSAEAGSLTSVKQNDINEKYAMVASESSEYREKLSDDNIYPDYIYLYESNRQLQGQSEKEAEKDAVEACIRTEALYKKAIDAGYQMSDDELDTYINNEIKAAKESQQYDAMEKIYEKSGRTYSEVMKENREIYRKTTAIGQWKQSIKDKKALDGEEWTKYDSDMTEKAVSEFKKTDEYKILKEALDKAVRLRREDAGIKAIKKEELDVYDEVR